MIIRKPLTNLLALSVFCLTSVALGADVPTDPEARAKLIGAPTALKVQPEKLTLNGPRATGQPVVTGIYADGTVRDLTHLADFKWDGADALVGVDAERFVTAKKNGAGTLTI